MNRKVGKRDPLTSAADKVFGIDELREEILKYVIYDNNGQISGKMVGTVRLVQKSWLRTTTKLLGKLKQPLIALTLDENGTAKDVKGKVSDAKLKEKQLDQLVETFGASKRLQESFLPVELHMTPEFFREKNYQNLSDCLTRLGSDLVELHVDYPNAGGTMPGILPLFSLPVLRKLTFQFSNKEIDQDSDTSDDDEGDVMDDSRNGLSLLSSILNATKNLKHFAFPFSPSTKGVPMDFKYIRLPSTISYLNMSIKLKSKDLEVLLRNQLPNLSHLTLMIHKVPFEDGLLFKIFKRVRKSLQTLELCGCGVRSDGQSEPVTYLRFPLMKILREIRIDSTNCKLGPRNVSALQKCLPELRHVTLFDQTKARLSKWTRNTIFKTVEELSVSVVNEQLDFEHESYYISPDIQILTRLHRSFPNIRYTNLTVNISDITGLKSLFQNMVQLRSLSISFVGSEAALNNSTDLIDSTFLGLPLWMVVGLKNDVKSLKTGKIAIKGDNEPSIRHLTELDFLVLRTKLTATKDANLEDEEEGMSLISDLLFRHAFLKMATLQTLWLYGRFKPSLEMQEEWKGQGRFIKYSVV